MYSQYKQATRRRMVHTKCRNGPYERAKTVVRTTVPDDKVAWSVPFAEYSPVVFTMEKILAGTGYSDPDLLTTKADLKFNTIDGKLDRTSFLGTYDIKDGLPMNPVGRTGMKGRGALGRWGPNHAADPIVTRWKRDEQGEKMIDDGKPVLQFVSILRGKSNEWAIPGGMVDAGEEVTSTLRREFAEEAMDGHSLTPEQRAAIDAKVEENFNNGIEIYRGYVDDPRNTDNAWMETVAINYHDDDGTGLGEFELTAGDDAIGVRWTDMNSSLNLYANHRHFIEKTAHLRNAYW